MYYLDVNSARLRLPVRHPLKRQLAQARPPVAGELPPRGATSLPGCGLRWQRAVGDGSRMGRETLKFG